MDSKASKITFWKMANSGKVKFGLTSSTSRNNSSCLVMLEQALAKKKSIQIILNYFPLCTCGLIFINRRNLRNGHFIKVKFGITNNSSRNPPVSSGNQLSLVEVGIDHEFRLHQFQWWGSKNNGWKFKSTKCCCEWLM